MENNILIQMLNIYKIYDTGGLETAVIKGISFTLYRGDKLIIIGPSGSGKTTLINILTGNLRATAGQVYWQGYKKDIGRIRERELVLYRRSFIALITQEDDLIDHLSVDENIKLNAHISEIELDENFYNQIVKLLGIEDLLSRLSSTLSRGEAKRVNIASVLMTRPEIIIGDEPVAGLDIKNANEILDLFDKINAEFGTTFILTSHDQSVVSRGNKIIELKDGIVFGAHSDNIDMYNLSFSRKIPIDRNGRILIPIELLNKLDNPDTLEIKFDENSRSIILTADSMHEIDKHRKCSNCGTISDLLSCESCGYPTIFD